MTQDELRAMLDATPVRDALPDSKAVEAVQDLLKHSGLPYLWSLMLGSRQAQLMSLSYAPLDNMGTVARAAVIQGTIRGIELFRDTLLEQAVPSQDDKEQN